MPARPAMRSGAVVLTLTLPFSVQPIATDLHLPALPAIGGAFGVGGGPVQTTPAAAAAAGMSV